MVEHVVEAEPVPLAGGHERVDLDDVVFSRAQADQAGNDQVAITGMVIVLAAFCHAGFPALLPLALILGFEHGAAQPIARARVEVLVDPRHDRAVGLLEPVTARVDPQRLEVVLLANRVLFVVVQHVGHRRERHGCRHRPARPVPLTGVALVGELETRMSLLGGRRAERCPEALRVGQLLPRDLVALAGDGQVEVPRRVAVQLADVHEAGDLALALTVVERSERIAPAALADEARGNLRRLRDVLPAGHDAPFVHARHLARVRLHLHPHGACGHGCKRDLVERVGRHGVVRAALDGLPRPVLPRQHAPGLRQSDPAAVVVPIHFRRVDAHLGREFVLQPFQRAAMVLVPPMIPRHAAIVGMLRVDQLVRAAGQCLEELRMVVPELAQHELAELFGLAAVLGRQVRTTGDRGDAGDGLRVAVHVAVDRRPLAALAHRDLHPVAIVNLPEQPVLHQPRPLPALVVLDQVVQQVDQERLVPPNLVHGQHRVGRPEAVRPHPAALAEPEDGVVAEDFSIVQPSALVEMMPGGAVDRVVLAAPRDVGQELGDHEPVGRGLDVLAVRPPAEVIRQPCVFVGAVQQRDLAAKERQRLGVGDVGVALGVTGVELLHVRCERLMVQHGRGGMREARTEHHGGGADQGRFRQRCGEHSGISTDFSMVVSVG